MIETLSSKDIENISKHMKKENKTFSTELRQLDKFEYDHVKFKPLPDQVWRSCFFVVQVFNGNPTRLSVNRTSIKKDGTWKENITWDELQIIKRQVGFHYNTAIELYPPDEHVVNECNIRHLWVLDYDPEFMWT